MWTSKILAIGFVFSGTTALPMVRRVIHKERRPGGLWKQQNKFDTETILPMRVALSQQNLHRAEEHLMDVSHHEYPKFGQH